MSATIFLPVDNHNASTTALIIPLLSTPTTIPIAPPFFKWAVYQWACNLYPELWWRWPGHSVSNDPVASSPLPVRLSRRRRSVGTVKGSGDDVLAPESICRLGAHDAYAMPG